MAVKVKTGIKAEMYYVTVVLRTKTCEADKVTIDMTYRDMGKFLDKTVQSAVVLLCFEEGF